MNNIFDISALNEAQKDRLVYKIGIALKELNDLDFIKIYNSYAEMVKTFSIEENTPENVNRYFSKCTPWKIMEMMNYESGHYHTSDKWFTVSPYTQGIISSNDPKAISMTSAEEIADEIGYEMISTSKAKSYGVKTIEKLITEALEESKDLPKINYTLKPVTITIVDADYIEKLLAERNA